MADQYTRITCGGSPLDRTDPVVGLLFGSDQEGHQLQITDAEDIPVDASEAATRQVSLHRAVFPQHKVVGWYRASLDDQPVPNDLVLTKQLQEHYQGPLIFALLQVPTDASEKDELPLTVYELSSDQRVLVNLERWTLQTSDAERIAVERVVREQPQRQSRSVFVEQTKSYQQSLLAIQERLAILVQFLRDTQDGKIPVHHALLRQVQGLLLELGPISATTVASQPDILQQLAVLAKTVDTVQEYTDKFRIVHETTGRPMTSREVRRF